jgi:hypothetical protein
MTEIPPLIVKPKDARRLLSCSQKRLYQLINAGELGSFLDGRSRKIVVSSIEGYIARKLEKGVRA